MHWYVIHTKPRQEQRALVNLEQQDYECYLPMLRVEKLRQGILTVIDEPLFPRYLFIRLSNSQSGKGWGTIRSTKGVSKLVTFGTEPAKVNPKLIDALRLQQNDSDQEPERLFFPNERLLITEGPFAGIEGIYKMTDSESRVILLIELLSKQTQLKISPASLDKYAKNN